MSLIRGATHYLKPLQRGSLKLRRNALSEFHFRQQSSFATDATKGGAPKRPVYLDCQATTPMDPRVLDRMMPFYVDMYGNPHSRSHAFGWEAEHYVEEARGHVAALIGAQSKEIIFTSGATESNNTIIKGVAQYYGKDSKKNHIVTTQIEHKCVLASCRDVQDKLGWDVTYLPVKKDGIIDLKQLEDSIRPETGLVSIMMVNNEIGVIQPMEEIAEICSRKGVLFHSDAAQACGKIPLDVSNLKIDLISISGHKLYGPKGAFYIRSRKPRIRLPALISGGGQERGFRSGTLPAPLIIGLGEACRVAKEEMPRDLEHVSKLERWFKKKLREKLSCVELNGSETQSFEAVEGESLLMSLKSLAVSSGSACTSASLEPSYVLRAIGVGEELAHTSLRFGFGRFTTFAEVEESARKIIENVDRLREMSPLWEMKQEGNDVKPVWT